MKRLSRIACVAILAPILSQTVVLGQCSFFYPPNDWGRPGIDPQEVLINICESGGAGLGFSTNVPFPGTVINTVVGGYELANFRVSAVERTAGALEATVSGTITKLTPGGFPALIIQVDAGPSQFPLGEATSLLLLGQRIGHGLTWMSGGAWYCYSSCTGPRPFGSWLFRGGLTSEPLLEFENRAKIPPGARGVELSLTVWLDGVGDSLVLPPTTAGAGAGAIIPVSPGKPGEAPSKIIDQHLLPGEPPQFNDPRSETVGIRPVAQAFTAGMAGTLAQIDLWLTRDPVDTEAAVLSLHETNAGDGSPGSQIGTDIVVPSSAIPIEGSTELTEVDVEVLGVPLQPGRQLAIAVKKPTGSAVTWKRAGTVNVIAPDLYASGSAWLVLPVPPGDQWVENVGQDLAFRTWVGSTAEDADFGDAPDGEPTGYPTGGLGSFPSLAASNGARAVDGSQMVLGETADIESDARTVNLDSDDGVLGMNLLLTQIPPAASLTCRVTSQTSETYFLNVLVDLNMDGEWAGVAAGGESEWAVRNYRVTVPSGSSADITLPPFACSDGLRLPDGAWLRVALTDIAILTSDPGGWDGTGLFDAGEIEDYVVRWPEDMKCAGVLTFPKVIHVSGDNWTVNNLGLLQLFFGPSATHCGIEYGVVRQTGNVLMQDPRGICAPVGFWNRLDCAETITPPAGPLPLNFSAKGRRGDTPSRWRYWLNVVDPPSSVANGEIVVGYGPIEDTLEFLSEHDLEDTYRVSTESEVESLRGFICNVHQIASAQPVTLDRAEAQLAGDLGVNVADPDQLQSALWRGRQVEDEAGPMTFELSSVVNFGQSDGGGEGLFPEDTLLPGTPGLESSQDELAVEVLAWLSLPQGELTFGVDSEQPFRFQLGGSWLGDRWAAIRLESEEGNENNPTTEFTVNVLEAGLYPARLVWVKGFGGSTLEWYTKNSADVPVLVNSDESEAIWAYRHVDYDDVMLTLSLFDSISPPPGSDNAVPDAAIEIVLQEGAVSIPKESIWMVLDGEVVGNFESDLKVIEEQKRIRITYTPEEPLAIGTDHTVSLFYVDGVGVQRWWSFGVTGSIQTAGDLLVDVDATGLQEGPLTYIPNNGTMGGGFQARGGGTTVPSVMPVNGNGTPGIRLDGNDYLQHVASEGGALLPAAAGLVGLDPTRSIEVWVFNPSIAGEETMVSVGKRGGPAGSNCSFGYGSISDWGALAAWGAPDIGWGPGGPPVAGQWHHLVYTYDGTTTRIYVDGVLVNSEVLGLGAVNTHPGTPIQLGAQLESNGTTVTAGLRGGLTISRVRIHDGVLTDAQVLNNYNAEKDHFENPTGEGQVPTPIHRWSFNNPASPDATWAIIPDLVGSAEGFVISGGGITTFTGASLTLSGGDLRTAPYVDLPNGLLSSQGKDNGGSGQITIEGWVKITGNQKWSRIFDFGSSAPGELFGPGGTGQGLDYLFLSAQSDTDVNNRRVEVCNQDGASGGTETFDYGTYTFDTDFHFAITWDEAIGTVKVYENGLEVGMLITDERMSWINDVNVWLGRSNWPDNNMQGEWDELRIYPFVLDPGSVLLSYRAGPDEEPWVTEEPPVLDCADNGDGTITLFWQGGQAPFTVQQTRDLGSGEWMDLGITPGRSVTIPILETSALFRLISSP